MTHGYITGAAAVSAQSVAEQGFRYGQRINGRVVSTRQLANYADDVVKGTKLLGKVSAGVSVGFAVYDFANSDMSGGDVAEFTGSVIITATAFIPIVGPVICIGLSMADAYGAFDSIYGYFEPTPQREEWKF